MSHNLTLAQNHAFDLARTLMVPVILFQVDDEFGVMVSSEYDGEQDAIVHEYDPWTSAHLSRVTGCRWRHAACKGSFAARGIRGLTACHRALASGTLRGRSGAFRKLWNKQDQPRKGLGLACG